MQESRFGSGLNKVDLHINYRESEVREALPSVQNTARETKATVAPPSGCHPSLQE